MEDKFEKDLRDERLENISQQFSKEIKEVTSAFGNVSDIVIIKFDSNSGTSSDVKEFLQMRLLEKRSIFYVPNLSRTNLCFIMTTSSGIDEPVKNKHVLFHEYAHHFQTAHAKFPFFVPQGVSAPSFVKPCYFGPDKADIRIDGFLLTSETEFVFRDLSERIMDIICERILIDRNLTSGILELLLETGQPKDFVPLIPYGSPQAMVLRKYVKRLLLWDNAEINAELRKAYPLDLISKPLGEIKEFALRENKGFQRAEDSFDTICELSVNTDYNLFRNSQNIMSYLVKILDLLNIKISTNLEIIESSESH